MAETVSAVDRASGRPLKILFVAHAITYYGASRSLRELVAGYDGVTADVVVPRFTNAPTDSWIREFMGPRVRKIVRFWLPWSPVYLGHPKLWQAPRGYLYPLGWRAEQRRFARFVEREGYDAVHLNSLVLHPMLTNDLPFIFHVRDILSEQHERVWSDAEHARGTIFIDEATRKPFEPRLPSTHIVLNNPIDMTAVGKPPRDATARLGGDPAELDIFAVVSNFTEERGLPFLVESFRQVRSPKARLLLVGQAHQPAMQARLERLAGDDLRIIFWGEVSDVAQIYTLADYVLRGEAYACVGRTIYEALFSGCGVVIPGERATHNLFEYDRFSDRIHFYAPRDRESFTAVLDSLAGKKQLAKRGESNVQQYVAAFDRFVRGAIGA